MEMFLSPEEEKYIEEIVNDFVSCSGNCSSCKAFEKIGEKDVSFCELLLTYRSHVQCEITRLIDNM